MSTLLAKMSEYCLRIYESDLYEAIKKPSLQFLGGISRPTLTKKGSSTQADRILNYYKDSKTIKEISLMCRDDCGCAHPKSSWQGGAARRKPRCCDKNLIPYRVVRDELANRFVMIIIRYNPDSEMLIKQYKEHTRLVDKNLIDNIQNLENKLNAIKTTTL